MVFRHDNIGILYNTAWLVIFTATPYTVFNGLVQFN